MDVLNKMNDVEHTWTIHGVLMKVLTMEIP